MVAGSRDQSALSILGMCLSYSSHSSSPALITKFAQMRNLMLKELDRVVVRVTNVVRMSSLIPTTNTSHLARHLYIALRVDEVTLK